MATIIPFLQENNAFDPGDVAAMSKALDDVCTTLKLLEGNPAREVIAERIIALARRGERNPTHLRDRVLGSRVWPVATAQAMATARWTVGALTAEPPSVLVAEGRVARQRQQVALLEARGKDATEARSVLSAMVYSLRVLRRQQRRDRELPVTSVSVSALR